MATSDRVDELEATVKKLESCVGESFFCLYLRCMFSWFCSNLTWTKLRWFFRSPRPPFLPPLCFCFIVSTDSSAATNMKAYQVEVLERLKVGRVLKILRSWLRSICLFLFLFFWIKIDLSSMSIRLHRKFEVKWQKEGLLSRMQSTKR